MEEKRNQSFRNEREQDRLISIVEGATNYHPESMRNAKKEGDMSQYGMRAGPSDKSKEESTRQSTRESSSQSSRLLRSTESIIVCGRDGETPQGDSQWVCAAAEIQTFSPDENIEALQREQQAAKRKAENRRT